MMEDPENDPDDTEAKGHRSCKGRCSRWLKSTAFSIYLMKALSSWGDRMWMFAVGLYLVLLSNIDLRLTAIYGLVGGACVILFGALVGDWVDRNPRLKVARMSLVIQNSFVIICAVILCLVITYHGVIVSLWGGHLSNICNALVICTAVVSKLASIATKIAVEKDWIVVICRQDKDKLANMNATMRRVDLLCNILAPVLVGMVMTYVSMVTGAVVIAAWNLFSVFVEYYLLWKIYKSVPELAVKKSKDTDTKNKDRNLEGNKPEVAPLVGEDEAVVNAREKEESANGQSPRKTDQKKRKSLVELIFGRFITVYKGWRVYFKQSVLPAGVAFSCEFMTVLAFDSITAGFAFSQGLSESVIGYLMAAGAVTGVAGTFVYPVLRKHVGLERTGLIAFTVFIGCLTLCVASIWAPGSPFDPTFSKPELSASSSNSSCVENVVIMTTSKSPDSSAVAVTTTPSSTLKNGSVVKKRDIHVHSSHIFSQVVQPDHLQRQILPSYHHSSVMILQRNVDFTISVKGHDLVDLDDHHWRIHRISVRSAMEKLNNFTSPFLENSTFEKIADRRNCSRADSRVPNSYVSIALLMTGIVCARFGLWLSDLTITQVFQENVPETERGVVGGVQSSLNMLMDVIRYTMVVIAPEPQTYGILILISFMSICLGSCSFAYYAHKKQGFFCFRNEVAKEKREAAERGRQFHLPDGTPVTEL